jgi:hypothetical protein
LRQLGEKVDGARGGGKQTRRTGPD